PTGAPMRLQPSESQPRCGASGAEQDPSFDPPQTDESTRRRRRENFRRKPRKQKRGQKNRAIIGSSLLHRNHAVTHGNPTPTGPQGLIKATAGPIAERRNL